MILYAGFLLLGVLISTVSQVMLKLSAMKGYNSLIKEYFNWQVIIAYVLFVVSMAMSIFAYRGLALSLGTILESTGYLFITILSALVFDEKITLYKFIAMCFIITGIIIYSC